MKKFLASLCVIGCAAMLAAPSQAAIVPKRVELDNGMVLLTSEQRALPMVSIELLIDAGSRYDAPQQEGEAHLTARLLTYGTNRRTAVQISDALDFIGASLSARTSHDLASVSLTVLKKDLATGLELLADVLTSATFPQEEIDRQKQSIIAAIRAREENPGDIAQRRFAALLYPQSPYGRPVEGTEASVKSLQQRGVREFYERYYRPNRSIMAVVGDVSQQEVVQALNQSLRLWRKGEPGGQLSTPSVIGSPQMIRVDKDLTQANIVMGHEGVPRDNPDYYAIQVMNYILGGGGFSSRAMDSVRNQRGLAYSVYSAFNSEKSHGTFEFVLQTKNETALEVVRILKEEVRRMREQRVSERELSDAKKYLTGSFPLRLDTNRKVANFIAQIEFFQLGINYPERYADLINKVTVEDVEGVAKRYLQPDKLITVIIGNQKKIGDN
ncbi:MAG: M16 family metallopeptidase [Deltaproteobacteria bacterium]